MSETPRDQLAGRLAGRVAVVTGAASGIGAATLERFIAEGATVVGLDVADRPLVDVGQDYRSVDVTDEAMVAAVFAAVSAEHGRIDAVVHAAGVAGGGPVHLLDGAEWDRIIDVNLKGTFHVGKAAATIMLDQERRGGNGLTDPTGGERGAIVNLASIEGLEGTAGGSAYNASKGGVVVLTKNMAIDYGRQGIRVNAICPGFIVTPMMEFVATDASMAEMRESFRDEHKLRRFGAPSEIASVALFLCSDDASFVTGQAIAVDGGYTAGRDHHVTGLMGL